MVAFLVLVLTVAVPTTEPVDRIRTWVGVSTAELAIDDAGRPVALRLHRGEKIGTLLVRWSGWQRIGAVRIPMAVQIDQGKDIFRFRFRPPKLEPPADAGWTPPTVAR